MTRSVWMTGAVSCAQRHRTATASICDAIAWAGGFLAFAWLGDDRSPAQSSWTPLLLMAGLTIAAHLLLAWLSQLTRGRATTGSTEEVLLLAAVVLSVGVAMTVLDHGLSRPVALTVPVGATLAALVVAAGARIAWRCLAEARRTDRTNGGLPVVVIGAGAAGRELVASMLRDPRHEWNPVGVVDDDPRKTNLRVRGVPVLGGAADLATLAARTGADTAIIAIPTADSVVVNRLRHAAIDAGLDVKVLPSTTQLLTDHVGIRDIRDVDLTDVLGRKQLDTDVEAIADYLTGQRVLVTGAGGSIGSELCRQIQRFAPAELMMLDRDESALHAVQLSIHGRALLDSDDVLLCDIRDRDALLAVFRERRPQVVFHAAALKHLPMLERFPVEAVKTNVLGTRHVLDAAEAAGVTTFVNVSTDKAANPCCVLGFSKRIAEALTAARAQRAERVGGRFVSVRFGNVLGSRGSVLTAFARQIAEGRPVTVTHPDVTRYFMTVEEACQLTIQAAAIGRAGEALVLDMGRPVRIVDVARQLMQQSGRRVDVEYTGLRPGEKLHEELFGDLEPRDARPEHPLVSHVPVPAVCDERLAVLPIDGPAEPARRSMAELCAELDAAMLPALAS